MRRAFLLGLLSAPLALAGRRAEAWETLAMDPPRVARNPTATTRPPRRTASASTATRRRPPQSVNSPRDTASGLPTNR